MVKRGEMEMKTEYQQLKQIKMLQGQINGLKRLIADVNDEVKEISQLSNGIRTQIDAVEQKVIALKEGTAVK